MAFSTTLECNFIVLYSAEWIARFSFIVQKSISSLDLSLLRDSWFPYDLVTSFSSEWLDLGGLRDVSSEEKCQKLFASRRYLLYTLHLDLPKGREHSLKEDAPKSVCICFNPNGPHLGRIGHVEGFHAWKLSGFIPYALETKTPKLKIFKWLLKLSSSTDPFLGELLTLNVNRFLACFYPEVTDSALFKDFIMHAHIGVWITRDVSPKVLEYLLRHARKFGRRDLDEGSVGVCLGNGLFQEHRFCNIGPVLKFISFPRFTSNDYRRYFGRISSVTRALTVDVLEDGEIFVKRERINHMLQIIWMYIVGRTRSETFVEATSEALRLLWSSFHDPYISYYELETVFGRVFTESELENIYGFYETAVGEFHEYVDPRSLQHLCRCTLRRILQENGIWIPEGIGRMGLSKRLQQFLNLEKKRIFPIPVEM